jgi:SAM-dependent methyltransferase
LSPVRKWELDPSAIDVAGDITLVVARRSGRRLHGYKVEFATGAGESIRVVCSETLERVRQRTARQYEASLRIDDQREYLAVPDEQLVLHESFRPKRQRRTSASNDDGNQAVVSVETDPQVRDLLRRASGLDRLPAEHLARFAFQFYAAVVGSDPGRRTSFVRKKNPAKVLKRGGLVFSYGDRLTEVADPLMLLDDRFDLVVAEDGLAVLDQDVFERLFRDVEVLAERYPVYAKAFETLQLGGGELEILVERCRRDSRLGARLRQIYESGHLAAGKVTTKQVIREIDRLELPRDRLLSDGKLDFSGADAGTILKLLNDDLFIGALSKVSYEAGSKARRR